MAAATVDQIPAWITAAIAAAAAVAGAIAAAAATVLAANKRVREVEIGYLQKIQESYLENARAYTQGVYVPIAIQLTKLSTAFDKFRVDASIDSIDAGVRINLEQSMADFVEIVQVLLERGASAFLTTTLESELEDFLAFVTASRTATSTLRQAVVRYSVLGVGVEGEIQSEAMIRQAYLMRSFNVLPFMVARVHIRRDQVLAAVPGTKDFEVALVEGIGRLRVLIKEVTLGSQARQSP
ncbi:hypothetical protein [Micromonospora sp. LHW51205]|uniref:hypothetical protein n=1 Tax=Micromonospora sp. LHW51205 TaxID=2248752 RepID=UPI0011BF1F11|nr:hypothetical protein [Micromonospora sp. LHW51205]